MSTGSEPSLRRVRWAVRAILWLSIAVSIAVNILDAQRNGISQAIHAWPPLGLFLAVELISRVPVARAWLARVRLVAGTVIALIAAWISYWHMVKVAHTYGESESSAHLLPFTVDALIVVASICLVELNVRMRAARGAAEVIAQAEEITRLSAQLDVARKERATAQRAMQEGAQRAAQEVAQLREDAQRVAQELAQLRADAQRVARKVMRNAQGHAQRATEDDARRAQWRALRDAHATESVSRTLMHWDIAQHGEPPALRTAQLWTRADAPASESAQ